VEGTFPRCEYTRLTGHAARFVCTAVLLSVFMLLYARCVWGIAEESGVRIVHTFENKLVKVTSQLAFHHVSEICNINIFSSLSRICHGQGTQRTTDKGVFNYDPVRATCIWPNIMRDL
jgi:hypothetical protein